MADPITAARREVAAAIAAEIAAGYRREGFTENMLGRLTAAAEARVLSRSGVLAPLLDAYEARLAQVTRERDELRHFRDVVLAYRASVDAHRALYGGPAPTVAEKVAAAKAQNDAHNALFAEVPRG